MKGRIFRFTTLVSLLMITLTGCSFTREDLDASATDATRTMVISDSSKLENNQFYILHDGKYYPVYMNNCSFNDEGEVNSTASDDRNLYFNDDWDSVPTCYSGDKLIFYTNDPLNDSFILEKFEYLGYSFGLSNLQKADTGRYYFNTKTSEEKNPYLNPDSDIYRLVEIYPEEEQLIIDTIGKHNTPLRSGNISRGGAIIGLNHKNAEYPVTICKGSDSKKYNIKADTIILTSMDIVDITNYYKFSASKTIEFTFPNYVNNGFYMINGKGIFRYVKGTTYTDGPSFNDPIKKPDEEKTTEMVDNEKMITSDKNPTTTDYITVNEEGEYKLIVTISETAENYEDPTIRLITEDQTYFFNNDGDNKQSLKVHLKAGKYKIELDKLFGRKYEIGRQKKGK